MSEERMELKKQLDELLKKSDELRSLDEYEEVLVCYDEVIRLTLVFGLHKPEC